MTSKEFEKLFLDLNSVLVKFWKEQGRPDKEIKIELLERMLNWYKKMGYVTLDAKATSGSSEIPKDLEEAAEKFARFYDQGTCDGIAQDCFIAGAKWQEQHDAELIEIAYNDGITIGMTKQKEQMMKDYSWLVSPSPNIEPKADIIHTTDTAPVDGKELLYVADKSYKIGWRDCKEQMLKEAVEGEVYLYHSYNRDATAILVDIPKENLGDKVRVIVCKKED